VISVPTTLVLGAGASVPYQFPTGEGLRRAILGILEHPTRADSYALEELTFTPPELSEFLENFRGSQQQSIDAFLEYRPEFLELGRTLIALALAPCEQPSSILAPEAKLNPWYHLLFKAMATKSLGEFEGNKLRIVTFNYDRSLEFALYNHIKYTWNASDQRIAELLKAIPIVHIYGQLAPLPWQGGARVRSYAPDTDPRKIEIARDQIQLVAERSGDIASQRFAEAQRHVAEAERLYFLGFSYDSQNVEHLNIGGFPDNKRAEGSAYGMLQSEQVTAQDNMSWRINLHDCDAQTFLRRVVVLDRA
jgi:hypothetical protein